MTQREGFGVVVRSIVHDRTWVGHVRDTDLYNTPAGPLRVVKAELLDQAEKSGLDGLAWRHPDPDTWVLEHE